jgi:hypothetical protein
MFHAKHNFNYFCHFMDFWPLFIIFYIKKGEKHFNYVSR